MPELTSGDVIAIVFGAILVVLLILFIIYLLSRRKRAPETQTLENSSDEQESVVIYDQDGTPFVVFDGSEDPMAIFNAQKVQQQRRELQWKKDKHDVESIFADD